ncbi:MFS transporter [Paenibacillus sp. SYP-B3998]|uniref:MFS transporter n=1 Tax=Paenibacillus sp. SYP-B3998 TaxID=2678564 RepID=A0A6G4A651_9BACL|nr:MFS transporter [Paenibacillus sp. SYP-B3998]NEW09852.1 MFS transporter [Paenibacillus sp. SYP-B3998]
MTSVSSSSPAPTVSTLLRQGIPAWFAAVVACLCAFMVVMDSAIVNVALPAMKTDLDLSVTEQQWVVDAYLLTLGGFMLLAARASDIYGRKSILQSGLILFTFASLVGGLATTGPILLAARAVQGLGGSVLATSTLAVIVAAYPRGAKQDRAISLWAASSSIASAFGVIIGGILTSLINWRWVMFVNVPIGIALSCMVAICLLPHPKENKRTKLDIPGAAAITLALTAFIFGITQTLELGWGAPVVLGSLTAALVLLLLFIVIEANTAAPLIRLSIFRHWNVRIGIIIVLGLGATLTANMLFLSLTLQQIGGYNPLRTGLALLPMAIMLAVAAIVSRRLRDAGFNKLPFLGGLLAAAGFIWFYWLPDHPDYISQFLLPSMLVGGGLGLMLMTAIQAVLAGIPAQDTGLASGLQNTARQLGGALGIATLITLAHTVTTSQIESGTAVASAQLAGYHSAFLAAGVISGLSAFTSLLLRRNRTD